MDSQEHTSNKICPSNSCSSSRHSSSCHLLPAPWLVYFPIILLLSTPSTGSPAPQVKPSGQSQSSRPNKPSEGIKQIHPPQASECCFFPLIRFRDLTGNLVFKGMKPIAVYRPSTSHPNGGGPRKSAWQIPTPPGAAAAADPTWEETKSSNACQSNPFHFTFSIDAI